MAGVASLALAAVSILAIGLAISAAGGVDAAKSVKHGALVAVPVALVATLLGVVGRRTIFGKLGLALASLALLIAAAGALILAAR